MQAEAPEVETKVPIEHFVQLATLPKLNVPGEHEEHSALPTKLLFPTTQATQTETPIPLYLPAIQSVHEDEPEFRVEIFPALQLRHELLPVTEL